MRFEVGSKQVVRRGTSGGRLARLLAAGLALSAGMPRSVQATVFNWTLDANSPWNDPAGWTPLGFPNANDDAAVLGSVISAPRTISLTSNIVVNQVVFDSSVPYTIGAVPVGNSLTIAGSSRSAGVDVLQGFHQIQADAQLGTTATIDVASGARLTFGVGLAFNGKSLFKTGSGELRIDSVNSTGNGALDARAGVIAGTGTLAADLINRQATVAPGQSGPGVLTVLGDLRQLGNGELETQIGASSSLPFDRLVVAGTATLEGTLRVLATSSIFPTVGDEFSVLTYAAREGDFDSIVLPADPAAGLKYVAIRGPIDVKVALGQSQIWSGGGATNAWNNAANWQSGRVPVSSSLASIASGGLATLEQVVASPILGLQLGNATSPGSLEIRGVTATGALSVTGNTEVAPLGQLDLAGNFAALNTTRFDNAGSVALNGGALLSAAGDYVQTGGTTHLENASLAAAELAIAGGTLSGAGSVTGDVIVGGDPTTTATLSPGTANLGELAIAGALQLLPESTLRIDFAQQGANVGADKVAVSGNVTLGGTLDLRNLAGVNPVPGAVYEILTAGSFEPGSFFDDILGLETPEGGSFGFDFDFQITNGLDVVYTMSKGDMNADQVVDEKDAERFAWAIRDRNTYFQRFLFDFDPEVECAPDPQEGCTFVSDVMADMDGDGFNTFADIPLFVSVVNSAAGAAVISSADVLQFLTPVPEPTAGMLAWLAWLATGFRHSYGGPRKHKPRAPR
jgi:hypothetical protein